MNQVQQEYPRLVLIVDDQEINRDAVEIALEMNRLGDKYICIFAENGKEALELINEHISELSMVILDLMMPVMNGFEVLEIMSRDRQYRHIPVIVMTADDTAELKALELGADDFITKASDASDIICARVHRIIELYERKQIMTDTESDPITGLLSRNYFFVHANRMFHSKQDTPMDAVVVNIEQFHTINAVNGRGFGDRVLRELGTEIQAILSEKDGFMGIASRFDADRFAIFCLSQEDYAPILDRLQKKVDSISPTVSIHIRMGVKKFQQGMEPIILFDQARAACSLVRGNYQAPLMVYNEEMRRKEEFNQRLLNDLNTALEEKQFLVYYQPKFDIQCNPPRLKSAEALVRWKHPEFGLVSPGDFVPLFEGNGLISVVDNFVWGEAARQIAKWRDRYDFTLPVSVNLSRADIFDPTIVDRLIHLVEDNGLSFQDIKVEVTESAYADDAQKMLDLIRKLREVGFEVEMDDFGSGYSSLNMLSSMPIDVLKMDMKFVRNIEENETDMRLVNVVLDIARYLNLRVVAEGVEKEGQLKLLKDAGCDLVQGYFFSRPLPGDEFEKLIENEVRLNRKD